MAANSMMNFTKLARKIVTLRALQGREVVTNAEKERVADLAVDILEVIREHSGEVSKSEVGAALGVTALYIGEIKEWPAQLIERRAVAK